MTPSRPASTTSALSGRVREIVRKGQTLEAEGIPYDSAAFVGDVRGHVSKRDLAAAITTVRRAEALLDKTLRDWTWLKELLARVDELRDLAARSGVDLEVVDQRIGNARKTLRTLPLAEGSLEKSAASASLALVVLNDTLPKFYTQESQQLARSIHDARERGEDVRESGVRLAQLLQALREGRLAEIGQRFIDLRRAVTRIPRAPAVPPKMLQREEEEILLEARNLARRLNRMKYRARDAQGAARLMTQVRAALSEDRRYGSPEEELEELWGEVDRLARERTDALAEPPIVADGEQLPSEPSSSESAVSYSSSRRGRRPPA
ncbi:MAG: hypothetical protein L3J97_05715 [Thermoplasmata archaeon]|nr:hypothetical protein [Thermoplasmata archaeon]